jgi:hypothetical protein
MPPRPHRLSITVQVAALAAMTIPLAALGAAPVAGATSKLAATYAVGRHVCRAPALGHASCLVMRRVLVSKSTPGARPVYLPSPSIRPTSVSGRLATIGPAGGLTPFDFSSAYGYSSTATGSTQTIALVEAFNDPNLNADLQTFDTNYAIAACSTTDGCLRIVNQSGGTTLPANDTKGWSVEESLDVEVAHAVCEHCKILVIEATDDTMANLAAAENEAAALGATEISNSYGDTESTWTSVASAYNHPGIVITAGSGDDGYYNWDQLGQPKPFNQAIAPASFKTVVAVGGTSLLVGQTPVRQSEIVWNANGIQGVNEANIGLPLGATGGGCSTTVAAPAWQTNLSTWASTVCGTHRLVADIAADADPLTGLDIYDSYSCSLCGTTGWQTGGGTSMASPLVAAMFALAGGSHGVAYPALTLYGHLGGPSLYDVTSGGDGVCDGEGAAGCSPNPNEQGAGIIDCDFPATGSIPSAGDRACDALPGYDGPSGVGTPVGLGAFAKVGPTATLNGPKTVVHGTSHTWTAVASDPFPAGVVTSYRWNFGDGSAVKVTTVPSAAHTYAKGGVKVTITLTMTDSYGQSGTKTLVVTVT